MRGRIKLSSARDKTSSCRLLFQTTFWTNITHFLSQLARTHISGIENYSLYYHIHLNEKLRLMAEDNECDYFLLSDELYFISVTPKR